MPSPVNAGLIRATVPPATVDEIAEGVVWMLSDRASFMTGASHVIDGGYYAA